VNRDTEITVLKERIRVGDVSFRDIEELAELLSARMPARTRAERNCLIRQLVDCHGALASTSQAVRWLTREATLFVGGADWARERHYFSCSFKDERRKLLWRILKFGDLPKRAALFEILSPDQ
jgi:hypothetical protein